MVPCETAQSAPCEDSRLQERLSHELVSLYRPLNTGHQQSNIWTFKSHRRRLSFIKRLMSLIAMLAGTISVRLGSFELTHGARL